MITLHSEFTDKASIKISEEETEELIAVGKMNHYYENGEKHLAHMFKSDRFSEYMVKLTTHIKHICAPPLARQILMPPIHTCVRSAETMLKIYDIISFCDDTIAQVNPNCNLQSITIVGGHSFPKHNHPGTTKGLPTTVMSFRLTDYPQDSTFVLYTPKKDIEFGDVWNSGNGLLFTGKFDESKHDADTVSLSNNATVFSFDPHCVHTIIAPNDKNYYLHVIHEHWDR